MAFSGDSPSYNDTIHRNADKSHLVSAPEKYIWSSFIVYYRNCHPEIDKKIALSEKKLNQIIDAKKFLEIFCHRSPRKKDFCDYVAFVEEDADKEKEEEIIGPQME